MIGQTIGHYEILEKIGEGGMGVVYKARDTHLDRAVAIKLLPKEKVADPDRERRFVQEAKAASALNHPSIVAIYDINKEGDVHYIAMEYVAGKTLDRLIGRKGIGLSDALSYSIQAADALSRAHSAGIVHRDLKPSNIMVTKDGRVKILDFGLAKLTEASDSDISDDETVTRGYGDKPITDDGMVVGTTHYMSPEQAEGKKVDTRSDIFSFGSVLYEMMTGARAFVGDTPASTLAAVITKDPKPPSQIVAGVSPGLEMIVLRCLRKDTSRRFQHMADVKVELEDVKIESDSQQSAKGALVRRRRWRWRLASAIVVPLFGIAAWLLIRNQDAPLPPPTIVPLTSYPGDEGNPSFSPDGTQVAFVWNGEKRENADIYVKLVDAVTPLRLTKDPAIDFGPAWSPDGRQIAFLRLRDGQVGVFLISPLGGPERKLADCRPTDIGPNLSWSPDGKWLAVAEQAMPGPNGIFLIPAERGEKRRLTSNSADLDHYPAFSPDGRFLAYASCTSRLSCDVQVLKMNPDYSTNGKPRRVTNQRASIYGLSWSWDGRSLIYAASQETARYPFLWRVSLSASATPERIEAAGSQSSTPAVSWTGRRLAYSHGAYDDDIWRFEVGGRPTSHIASSLSDRNPQYSADGGKIAFSSGRSGVSEIWISNPDGSNPVQLTNRLGRHQGSPRWSPDDRFIAFDSQGEDGMQNIYVVDAAGGQPRRMTMPPHDGRAASWSRDGRSIYFASNRSGRFEIWRVPMEGGACTQITDNGGYVAFESWDGKTLYYTKSGFSGEPVFARSLPGGAERQMLDSVNARAFVVVEDGIYYISQADKDGASFLRFFDFASGKSRVLTRIEAQIAQGLTVSPDRKTFLFSVDRPSNFDLMMIENFR